MSRLKYFKTCPCPCLPAPVPTEGGAGRRDPCPILRKRGAKSMGNVKIT